jgi:AcrR family transcriptional regulator
VRALPGEKYRVPPGHRPVARTDAAIDQRRRILAVTAELVAKRGYSGTTTELIVRRAKVGYATFYKFFKNKEECFLFLFDETAEAARATLSAAWEDAGRNVPWAQRIAAVIEAFYAQVAAEPAAARACLVESLTAGPALLARYDAALGEFAAIFRAGRGESERTAALPGTVENTVAGGVLWIAYQQLIVGESDLLPTKVPEAIQFALTPYVGELAAIEIASRRAVAAAG